MKPKIALITGGYTGEAEVSIRSAAFVNAHLDREQYAVYPIVLTPESWYYEDEQGQYHEVDRRDFSISVRDEIIRFDLAFIMVHGSPGEDGLLQGYLDMVGIRYASCDTLTSALTMNKDFTKKVLVGIPDLYLAKSVCLTHQYQGDGARLVQEAELSFPIFVKPNAGGSSIGMSKVKDAAEVQAAIDLAFDTRNTGKQVIVEEFVRGREFSIGVYRQGNAIKVLPATEVITTKEFFDYEAKYTPGLTDEITPADLTPDQNDRIAQIVREIYERLNAKGMVRIDFFLEALTDRFYFIEINTIPGQTGTSFIPQQVRAAGMTEKDFYSILIREALA